jgi:hypothetical protein
MHIPPSVIIGALQIMWPFVADEVTEAAAKTETKWDDRGVKVIDALLGRINPAELDPEDLVGYFMDVLKAVAPDLVKDKEKLLALMQIVDMTDE